MEDDDWTDNDDEHEYRPYSLDDDPDPWEEYFRVYGLDRPLGSEAGPHTMLLLYFKCL